MELKDYTTEELREELRRRKKEAIRNAVHKKPEYIEVEGVVVNIRNIYNSFVCTDFRVKTNDERVPAHAREYEYKIKQGKFRKNELPKVGDTVIIGHLLTKNRNSFKPIDAKIIRIVKRKEE